MAEGAAHQKSAPAAARSARGCQQRPVTEGQLPSRQPPGRHSPRGGPPPGGVRRACPPGAAPARRCGGAVITRGRRPAARLPLVVTVAAAAAAAASGGAAAAPSLPIRASHRRGRAGTRAPNRPHHLVRKGGTANDLAQRTGAKLFD